MLKGLKKSPHLSHYSLTLYQREPASSGGSPVFTCRCSVVEDPKCWEVSQHFIEKELEKHFQQGEATVCRYGGGFLAFVIPFQLEEGAFCLVGDGVRDEELDLWQLAALSSQGASHVFALFPHLESLCTVTREEVEQTAQQVQQLVDRYTSGFKVQRPAALPRAADEPAESEPHDPRLHAVADALEQLDRAATLAETIALASETLISNFKIAGLAVALQDDTGSGFRVTGLWGAPAELGFIPHEQMSLFLARNRVKRTIHVDSRVQTVLPELKASLYSCFPLQSQDERLGFLAVLDTELCKGDGMLISMVAHATAARLKRIVKDAEQARANEMSGRLMSLANSLLMIDDKDELYQAVLRIASELVDAAQGSVMLIEKGGKNLRVVCSRGMTPIPAQDQPLRVGRGIAGAVAESGEPLLVNDVEKDLRVASANRPRFQTKSLLCVPLKLKETVIGVLNLADKKNGLPFNNADLQMLTSFANLASLMIERSQVLEESVRFEQLSVTDPLTGLYNRRYLKSRLEEELSRSVRQGLNLTLLFIDLDMFKSYNDICGHIAGDEALKKTAEILRASVRDMDIVARYGGEEFCAVLPGTSKVEALLVAERIRREIESESFAAGSAIPFRRMTASLGVATFPEDGRSFTALVHASDMALYRAKAAGRNRIVAAAPQEGKPHCAAGPCAQVSAGKDAPPPPKNPAPSPQVVLAPGNITAHLHGSPRPTE